MSYTVRRLAPEDLPAIRALRLEALAKHPSAYGANLAAESAEPEESYYKRLSAMPYVGGFQDDKMVAIAALALSPPGNATHIGKLVSVYVQPAARGTGLSRNLIEALIEIARTLGLEQVTLNVEAGNSQAARLYERLGFVTFGRHPKSLKVGRDYYDEVLMVLELGPKA